MYACNNTHIFEKPVERCGGLHVFLVFRTADVENFGVIEEEFAPFSGEAFAMRIDPRKVVARRSADEKVKWTPLLNILGEKLRWWLRQLAMQSTMEKGSRILHHSSVHCMYWRELGPNMKMRLQILKKA